MKTEQQKELQDSNGLELVSAHFCLQGDWGQPVSWWWADCRDWKQESHLYGDSAVYCICCALL